MASDPAALDLARRTVRNADLDLAVFEAGDPAAPTVLLVHGWPDTHQLWHRVTEHLVSAGLHVVSYDTRGMGETSDPGTVAAFSLAELATDLFAVADAVSPDAPVHVLGHDWGSVQAWEAVCDERATERIASFTSISGPNLDHLGHWMRRRAVSTPRGTFDVLRQGLSSSYVAFFVSPLAPPAFRTVASKQRWDEFLRRAEGLEPHPDNHAPTLEQDMVSGLRYYRANVLRGLGGPRERRTKIPVLQLVATEDPAIRPANLDESSRWAENLSRREVPYGHWIPLSAPQVVAEETARFIRSVG